MQLIVGYSYSVLDWMKMVSYSAKYLGRATSRTRFAAFETTFLFEIENPIGASKLAGCEVLCTVDSEGMVIPYLHATHYGNSLKDFKACSAPRYEPPNWKLDK